MTDDQQDKLRACLKYHGGSDAWIAYVMPGLVAEVDGMLITVASEAHKRGYADAPRTAPAQYPDRYTSSGGSSGSFFDPVSFILGTMF